MNALLTFSAGLMGRLTFPRKFALLGAVALLAIGVLLVSLYLSLSSVIAPSKMELRGLEVIHAGADLIRLTQQHRGASSAVLSGNNEMKAVRSAKEQEVIQALNALAGKLPAEKWSGLPRWEKIRQDWNELQTSGLSLTQPENIRRHTLLIESMLMLQGEIADHYQITLDPDLDSYYLYDTLVNKLPAALEQLGQLRARGTALLTKKEATEAERIAVASLLTELGSAMRHLELNLDKGATYNPAIAPVLKKAAEDIHGAVARHISLIQQDILGGVYATPPKQYFDDTTAVIDLGYRQMFEILQPTMAAVVARRIEAAQWQLNRNIGLALLCSLAFALIALSTYFSINRNLRALYEGARQMADGDLRVHLQLQSSDELNTVAEAFNSLSASLRKVLGDVQSSAAEVADMAGQLTNATRELSSATEQQSQAAANMAATVEELTAGIAQIGHSAAEARDESQRSGRISMEGGQVVARVAKEVEQLADSVRTSAGVVQELGQHSGEISAVIGTIKDIAEQTNLLALNAAIEAARAGEQGRGFAVVADEVRKLSERTAQSTREIGQTIERMQHSVHQAVNAMQDGVGRVSAGVDEARKAGDAMLQIRNAADHIGRMVNDISVALSEQNVASEQMAGSVERIAQMTEEHTTTVGENADTARHLSDLAGRLRAEVSHFRL
jgi:methyl-accepting chemotaxis protein